MPFGKFDLITLYVSSANTKTISVPRNIQAPCSEFFALRYASEVASSVCMKTLLSVSFITFFYLPLSFDNISSHPVEAKEKICNSVSLLFICGD